MIPELGQFALILALFVVLALTTLPLLGAQSGNQLLMLTGRSLATGFFVLIIIAFLCLVYAFVNDDCSVASVSSNSNSLLPVSFKISAVWGGHQGSLPLRVLMLAGWPLAIGLFTMSHPPDTLARVLPVTG